VAATIPSCADKIGPPGTLQLVALGERTPPQPMFEHNESPHNLRAATTPCCLYSSIVGKRKIFFATSYDDIASLGRRNHLAPEVHGPKNNMHVAKICNVTSSNNPEVLQTQGGGRAVVPVFLSKPNINYLGVISTTNVAAIAGCLPDAVLVKAFPSQWYY
jgi:hypothetical protein